MRIPLFLFQRCSNIFSGDCLHHSTAPLLFGQPAVRKAKAAELYQSFYNFADKRYRAHPFGGCSGPVKLTG
jgi:hypothetical protein